MNLKLHALGALSGFFLAALVVAFAPMPLPRPDPTERTFKVDASRFEFSPSVLTVNHGDRVTIELTSTDVVHGLYLDGYNLETTTDPGQTTTLTFTADSPGSFRFRCSVTCGDMHPFMIGKIRVGHNILLWRGIGLVILVGLGVMSIQTIRFRNNQSR